MMLIRATRMREVGIVLLALYIISSNDLHHHGVRADFSISTNQQHVPTDTELSQSACTNDAQCLNGGTCTPSTSATTTTNNSSSSSSTLSNYQRVCDCPSGYGGSHCQDHCPLHCENGGYCQLVDSRDPSQYRTSNLESRYDGGYSSGTSGSGSGSGTTSSSSPSYQCKCRGLFSGKLCNVPYQNCPNSRKCYNGGSCLSSSTATSSSYCTCPDGFGGASCDQKGDGFTSSQGASGSPDDNGAGRSAGIAVAVLLAIGFVVLGVGLLVGRIRRARRQRRHNQPYYKSVLAKDNNNATNLRPHPEFWESEAMPMPSGASASRSSSFTTPGNDQAEREYERDPLRMIDATQGLDDGDADASTGMTDDRPETQHRWRNIV